MLVHAKCTQYTIKRPLADFVITPSSCKMMLPFMLLSILFPLVLVSGQIFQPVRINCGGPQFRDTTTNITWLADSSLYNVGNKGRSVRKCSNTSVVISNTTAALRSIYCSHQLFRAVGAIRDVQPYEYSIPVLNTTNSYTVRLHFAEISLTGINARRMDVWVEGTMYWDELNVNAVAGYSSALVFQVPTPIVVTDGRLTIQLTPSVNNPFISAIEVLLAPLTPPAPAPITTPTKVPTKTPTKAPTMIPSRAPTNSPTKAPTKSPTNIPTKAPTKLPTKAPTNVPVSVPIQAPIGPIPAPVNIQPPVNTVVHRINCGSPTAVTDVNGTFWSRDVNFVGGFRLLTCPANVTNNIYCSSRYFRNTSSTPARYNLPVPANGNYLLRLHFAEHYFSAINQRKFDVTVEDLLVIDDLDIFATAPGRDVPRIISFGTTILDGNITIQFLSGINNPQINGIEVISLGPPVAPPTNAPITSVPTAAPVTVPPVSVPPVSAPATPVSSPIVSPASFQDIVINCGGPLYLEDSGLRYWAEDNFFTGGSTYSISSVPIANTADDELFQSIRLGSFSYSIPVPLGNYEVSLHLAELVYTTGGRRRFNVSIEGTNFPNVDIVNLAGAGQRAVDLTAYPLVTDGAVTITFSAITNFDQPCVSGIEIKRSVPHLAHSVANGPYHAVDITNTGFGVVNVDGSESHTHGVGMTLTNWTWTKGAQILGRGEITSFTLPVGTHNIALTVIDSGGNIGTEAASVVVSSFGFPDISSLTPNSGSITGDNLVTITGTGFTFSSNETTVNFGGVQLTGADVTILSSTTITVVAPLMPLSVPVQVSVETPLGRSDEATYTYTSTIPIAFTASKLMDFEDVTVGEFGPDGKLYVGTVRGTVGKITLNADFTTVISSVTSIVQPGRAILGLTFDPMDAGEANPPVYITSSELFHGEVLSSSGKSINGKICRISGANLDVVTDVITGLPVSDLDHALNSIVFGDNGELYISIGSNTNGGVPGRISRSGLLIESFFSASIVVARLALPTFNGAIQYDAPNDGNPTSSTVGVEVFAPGLRNPFGLVLHSNGLLYATDNGPNTGYGEMKNGCDPSDIIDDQQREDKMVIVQQGKYYGHPNPRRAAYYQDPRQCVWRNPTEVTSADYEAPIAMQLSSATGIIEYTADYFNGQLRGNLLHVKYKSTIRRTVLSPDGLSVNPLSRPALSLVGSSGLDVAQAPNGNLIEIRYSGNTIFVQKPTEAASTVLKVYTVFPNRGGLAGGTLLKIYGTNFGTNPTVTIGTNACPPLVGRSTNTYIECTLPGGSGTNDVVVTSGSTSYKFERGYRYIPGA